MSEIIGVKTRAFGGKLSGFKSRDEANREKKHLRSYLKGHKQFRHGNDAITGKPIWFDVIENWI